MKEPLPVFRSTGVLLCVGAEGSVLEILGGVTAILQGKRG